MSDTKRLIIYYSLTGNTKFVAETIKEQVGGDIFEIETVKEYPKNYNDIVKISKHELENNITPELKKHLDDISDYDVIYIGTPVWWYTLSNPLKAFMLENDFSGKIIKPFCTHGGGGASSTFTDMKTYAPKSILLGGLSIYERGGETLKSDIEKWINQ